MADFNRISNGQTATSLFRRPLKSVTITQLHSRQHDDLMSMPNKVARRVRNGVHERDVEALNRNRLLECFGIEVQPELLRFADGIFKSLQNV